MIYWSTRSTHFTMQERVSLLAMAVQQKTTSKMEVDPTCREAGAVQTTSSLHLMQCPAPEIPPEPTPMIEGDEIMAACREAGEVETNESLQLMQFLASGNPPKEKPTTTTSTQNSLEEGQAHILDIANNNTSLILELESDPNDPYGKYEAVNMVTIGKIMDSIRNNNILLYMQMIAHVHSQAMLAKNLDLMDDLETNQIMQEVKDQHH